MAVATSQHIFEASNLPTVAVTVYADRAEVKRFLKTHLNAGSNEIVVKKLTRSIDKESIRVDGRGNASILEVQYQEKHVKKEDEIRDEQKEISKKLEHLRDERDRMVRDIERMRKQRALLDGLADKIGKSTADQSDSKKPHDSESSFSVITDSHLQGLDKFFVYYVQRSELLDNEMSEKEKKKEKIVEEITVVERNFYEVADRHSETALSREVSILLEAVQAGSIELDVSYIVWNASWKPSYDIRVYTADRAMKMYYYGLVEQNTGEEWSDVKLSLSTATPSVGGQIPELGTLKVGFYRAPPPQPPMARPMMMKCGFGGAPGNGAFQSRASAGPEMMEMQMHAMPLMDIAQSNVQDNVISTSFEIPRSTTIPSDNTSHKVTVALIDLKPLFEYETVPSKSALAFLKARVQNTSPYPLLAGPTSVFLDNNFVAKSRLKAVSPMEEFSCSLGVDNAVRVEYKPARTFHEETGLLTRASATTHEQKIIIKNTRADGIRIVVIEHLPLSDEEKLKVHLIEPQLKESMKYVRLNKHNNVEWEVEIKAGETKEILLKYQLEHPKSERIEYKEEEA